MSEFDLNIDNYTLDELLDLFKLKRDFTADEFKSAKSIVLKMHPDKSKLDKNYFIFFSKAYKLLYKVNEFKNKKTNLDVTKHGEMTYEEYMGMDPIINNNGNNGNNGINGINNIKTKREESAEQQIVNKISKKANFSKWFNDAFEKNYINQEDEDGYGDWMSSNDDLYTEEKDDKEKFRIMKERNREHAITIAQTPQAIAGGKLGGGSYGLGGSMKGSFSGGDLRTVYRDECVLSVDETDYDKSKAYSSLEDIKQERSRQNIKPMNNAESKRQLLERHNEEQDRDTERAMRLVEQEEIYKKQNKQLWSSLLKITNN